MDPERLVPSIRRSRAVSARFMACALILFASLLHGFDADPSALLSAAVFLQTGPDSYARVLERGVSVERLLSTADGERYRINAQSAAFVHVRVDQMGLDLSVSVVGPDGQPLLEFDSVAEEHGVEHVRFVAEREGAYGIQVKPVATGTIAPAPYRLELVEVRPATADDRTSMRARLTFSEAERERQRRTSDSLRKALALYRDALQLWESVGEQAGQAEAVYGLAFTAWQLGDARAALADAEKSVELFRAIRNRSGEADALNMVALNLHNIGDRQKALAKYQEALAATRAAGNRRIESSVLNNLGQLSDDLGDRQKARDYYSLALPLKRQVGDRRGEAVTLVNIGITENYLGQNQAALDSYAEALKIFQALGDRRGEAAVFHSIARVHDDLRDLESARDYYLRALPLRIESGDRRGEATTRHSLGSVYNALGEPDKAIEFYTEALAQLEALDHKYGQAYTLSSLANIHVARGDTGRALDLLNRALPLRRAVGDVFGEAYTLMYLGNVYTMLNDYSKALEQYAKALPLFQAGGNQAGEILLRRSAAQVERERGNVDGARSQLEAALALIETFRSSVASRELRTSYLASVAGTYEAYTDLLMQLHRSEPGRGFDRTALHVVERARARSHLEILAESHAEIRQGVEPALLEQERTLQQQINAKASRQQTILSTSQTVHEREALSRELKTLLGEYRQLQTRVRATSPRYAALMQPQPLTLEEIQQQVLDPDTLLLEYALGEERSYAWVVTQSNVFSTQLSRRSDIESLARRVHRSLTERSERRIQEASAARAARIGQADTVFRESAVALARLIVDPIASRLDRKRIIVVADGALQYVPFGALPLHSAGGNLRRDADAGHALLSAYEIISLPSASTLAVLRRDLAGREPAPKAVAVLADPVFDADDRRLRARSTDRGRDGAVQANAANTGELVPALARSRADVDETASATGLARLAFSRREADAILVHVPPSERLRALDFEANRTTATSPALRQFRILHIATHALLNPVHPELSGVVLSLVNERGVPQDGFLRLHDIYNLDLPTDLVVLSACQTGLGKDVKAEGLIGLTRGFMYAGAARVVVSLWKVDDEATAVLMEAFYAGLLGSDRLAPATALRRAQLSLARTPRWRSPYYWAGFVLQGEYR